MSFWHWLFGYRVTQEERREERRCWHGIIDVAIRLCPDCNTIIFASSGDVEKDVSLLRESLASLEERMKRALAGPGDRREDDR